MKRQTIGVCASLAVVAVLVTTQVTAQSAQAADPQKPAEVTLTGCLIQGSTPTLFVLEKAKKDPASRTEQTQSYVVINKVEDMDLTSFLNHQVRITGMADKKADPTRPTAEKNLPTLTASAIVNVADTCASPGR